MDLINRFKKSYTKSQLYNWLKQENIKGYSQFSHYKLAEKVAKVLEQRGEILPLATQTVDPTTVAMIAQKNTKLELVKLLRTKNIKGYSQLNKTKLAEKVLQFSTFNFDDVIIYNRKKFFQFDNDIFVEPRERSTTDIKVVKGKSCWGNMVVDFHIYCESKKLDLIKYLFEIGKVLPKIILREFKNKKSINIQLVAVCNYIKTNEFGKEVDKFVHYFRSTNTTILNENEIVSSVISMKNDILREYSSFTFKNTKYFFDSVIRADLQSDITKPLRGGTYVQLPKFIFAKRCCINVNNAKTIKFKCVKQEHLRCFEYALESILRPVEKHTERVSNYDITKYEELDLEYPIEITSKNINTYEEFLKVSINIYRYDEDDSMFHLEYLSKYLKIYDTHVNLLLYKDHVVGIKNLSALLRGKIHNYGNHVNICMKCHRRFEKKSDYENHINVCIYEKKNIQMPKNDKNIRKYCSLGAEQYHPYTLTLDFECTLQKQNKKITDTTQYIHKHNANSFCFYSDQIRTQLKRYPNPDTLMKQFNKWLIEHGKRYHQLIRNKKDMIYGENDKKKFEASKDCHICGIQFENTSDKVRDHDHFTGEFRGAACNKCNLKLQKPRFIPILIHNLKYDSKIFITWLLELSNKYDMKIVPNNGENYKTFSKKVEIDEYEQEYDFTICKNCNTKYYEEILEECHNKYCKDGIPNLKVMEKGEIIPITMEFRFIDTLNFIGTSLEKAVKNLAEVNNCYCSGCKKVQEIKGGKFLPVNSEGLLKYEAKCKVCEKMLQKPIDYSKFENIVREFKKEDLHLVLQKGIYPYEWVDTYNKFLQQLPENKEDWHSTLNNSDISENDLVFAKTVYQHFKCKNFGDYHDLYLKLDTILTKDIFDNFRKTCYKNYNLDPVYYVSAPQLADSAALKYTKQNLELLTDQETYELYEKGIKGGISMIPHRHAVANNCYFYDEKIMKTVKLPEEEAEKKGIWDKEKNPSYIQYLDANNLYGWAMSKPLPIGGFMNYKLHGAHTDMKPSDFTRDVILNLEDDDEFGYTFIADLEIPPELHNKFRDYPMLPEHYTPKYEELSDYQKSLIDRNIGNKPKYGKLVCNLYSKKDYIIDFRMLKECLRQGITLISVTNYIRFNQKAWLKPYIDLNTKLRQEAKNDFEKDFYKLMNNSVYGKQMENVRKRCEVKLLTSFESFIKQDKYNTRTIINEKTILLHRQKKITKLNKPIYGGFAVLELSKLLMYRFYYNVLKEKYGDRIKLLGTDTDSLIIYIETEDVYKDLSANIEHYDTSEYKIEWIPQKNKKVPGLFKDEHLGIPIREFVGLRSKMYAFRNDIQEKKVCKGIRRCNIEKMKFNMYKNCLLNDEQTREKVYGIMSKKYRLYTIELEKIALSPYDDKRYLIDNINTLPFGYQEINNQLN